MLLVKLCSHKKDKPSVLGGQVNNQAKTKLPSSLVLYQIDASFNCHARKWQAKLYDNAMWIQCILKKIKAQKILQKKSET